MRDEHTDLALVMQTAHGRRLIQTILDMAGVNATGFTGDPQRDTFNAGKREIGRGLEAMARATCFEDYILMVREKHESGRRTDT